MRSLIRHIEWEEIQSRSKMGRGYELIFRIRNFGVAP